MKISFKGNKKEKHQSYECHVDVGDNYANACVGLDATSYGYTKSEAAKEMVERLEALKYEIDDAIERLKHEAP